jgi:hypothetical protein
MRHLPFWPVNFLSKNMGKGLSPFEISLCRATSIRWHSSRRCWRSRRVRMQSGSGGQMLIRSSQTHPSSSPSTGECRPVITGMWKHDHMLCHACAVLAASACRLSVRRLPALVKLLNYLIVCCWCHGHAGMKGMTWWSGDSGSASSRASWKVGTRHDMAVPCQRASRQRAGCRRKGVVYSFTVGQAVTRYKPRPILIWCRHQLRRDDVPQQRLVARLPGAAVRVRTSGRGGAPADAPGEQFQAVTLCHSVWNG